MFICILRTQFNFAFGLKCFKHGDMKMQQKIQIKLQSTLSFRTRVITDTRYYGHALLRTRAITDKIQIPIYRGLTENDCRYYGFSLFQTQKRLPEGVRNKES